MDRTMAYSPTYLVRNPHSFCFRMIVPKDLQAKVARKELRYSLKTGNLSDAKIKARFLAGQVQLLFRNIRNKGFSMNLSDTQIQSILRKFMAMLKENYDSPVTYKEDDNDFDPTDDRRVHEYLTTEQHLKEYIKVLDYMEEGHKNQLLLGDYSDVEEDADLLLAEEGFAELEIDKGSAAYAKLCSGLLRAEIKGVEYQRSIMTKGKFSDDLEDVIEQGFNKPNVQPTPTLPVREVSQEPVKQSKTISQVMDDFFEEGDAEGLWKVKTRGEIKASLQVLVDYFGDVPINTIDRSRMRDFKLAIIKLPPNMNKDKRYRDLSIHEILELEPKETIKTLTIKKYLGRANTLFDYAVNMGEITLNPASKMTVKQDKRSDERKTDFNTEELIKIFQSPQYKQDSFKLDYQFWTLVLAIFTGARQEEICSLRLKDFEEHEGIWCLNIIADDGKDLKNMQSRRLIPLHPFLVDDLGIIKRVENLKRKRKKRFLPDLKPMKTKDGLKYGPYCSRWFNERYKQRLGFPTREGKDFHSFRHTFGTNLHHNGINDHSLKAMLGHAEDSITFSTYVKRGTPTKLYRDLVAHLNFEGLNLSHLKNSKWVVK